MLPRDISLHIYYKGRVMENLRPARGRLSRPKARAHIENTDAARLIGKIFAGEFSTVRAVHARQRLFDRLILPLPSRIDLHDRRRLVGILSLSLSLCDPPSDQPFSAVDCTTARYLRNESSASGPRRRCRSRSTLLLRGLVRCRQESAALASLAVIMWP